MTSRPVWRWRAFGSRFAIALGIIAFTTASGFGYSYWYANHIFGPGIDVPGLAPEKPAEPANYLIVGSDTRAFVHDAVAADHFGTARTNPENLADVIMIAHVDPNTPDKGFLASIPRDSWVTVPGHGTQKINAAFNYGHGPALLIKTIQQNFNVKINHYLKLDFLTFTDVVNAIGRVHIFFPAQARDTFTGLSITTPGCNALDGLQALAYARSRHYETRPSSTAAWSKDDPRSDIGRIQRQQSFIRSLAQEAIRKSSNPLTAHAIVQNAVKHLEYDSGMGLSDFLRLAQAFRSVDPAAVQMVTVPTKSETLYPNGTKTDVQIVQPDATVIFRQLGDFTPATKAPKLAPATIRVQVLNGSNVRGIAATTQAALHHAGFANGGTPTDADHNDHANTLVRYRKGNEPQARVVASYLGGVGLLDETTGSLGSADVVVITGADLVAVHAPGSTGHAVSTATTAPPNPGSTPGVTAPPTPAGRPLVGCG